MAIEPEGRFKPLILFHEELDTARVYCRGAQEAFTAFTNYKELDLRIATKAYPNNSGDRNLAALRATLMKSWAELNVDSVDVFICMPRIAQSPLPKPSRNAIRCTRKACSRSLD
jgi:diketogulonate reductase-like aldo/keto reductase